jgi:hypothetical protein
MNEMHWIIVGLLIGIGLMLAPVTIALADWVITCFVIALVLVIRAAPWTIIPLVIASPLFSDPSLPLASALVIAIFTLLGWLASRLEAWKEKHRLAHEAERPKYPIYTNDHYGNPIAINEDGSSRGL